MQSFAQKIIWGTEKVKNWHSRGHSFDECREKLLEAANVEGIQLTEDDAITIIRETEEYSKNIINQRKKNLAREDPENISQYPEVDLSEMPHWSKYIENLKNQGWDDSIIDGLDEHCTAIVDAILNANKRNWEAKKRTKGLVIGHIQSGKTANMAGIMALCADRGFDAVFVLSGIHNKLNEQTTRRFERDLWTYDLWAKEEELDRRGIQHLKSQKKSWSLLTKESDLLGDNAPSLITIPPPIIGVFKKNINVLDRLYKWLNKWHENNTSNLKVLFIDDECDQASPNVADLKKNESSAINEKLWEILGLLPKTAYVGYTATPFANILNEAPDTSSLYPSDFIYKLPKDEKYFGTKEFFGKEDNPDEDGLDIIRKVPEISDDSKYDYPSLKKAIGYFICSSTIRRFCRDYSGHLSMLVHVSHIIKDQDEVAKAVNKILEGFRSNNESTIDFLRNIWNSEYQSISREDLVQYNGGEVGDYHQTESFDRIENHVKDIIEEIIVRIDNSEKDEDVRLHYGEDPITVIAIGGNTLSRGLTLEGLNVSYFTRPGTQYDSLLQMGRWFGYRNGYEDLVRVWTTEKNAENFRYLCLIEEDLRRQISDIYENSGATPEDIALTVASHPSMRIVRNAAMQEAVNVNTTFFNTAPQTIYFRRNDRAWLENNWNAGNSLLENLSENDKLKRNGWLCNADDMRCIFKTKSDHIIAFFNRSNAHSRHSDSLDSNLISQFIEKAVNEGYLLNWHVAVASSLENVGKTGLRLEDYKYLTRSRLNESLEPDDSVAAIKALRARGDLFYDINSEQLSPDLIHLTEKNSPFARKKLFDEQGYADNQIPGLLLLYPIDKTSNPKSSKNRTALEAATNVLGWSIVFPSIRANRELIDRVGIPLNH